MAKLKNISFLVLAVALLSFGTFNLSMAVFAQSIPSISPETCVQFPNGTKIGICPDPWQDVGPVILEQLISVVGPLVSGAVLIGTRFLKGQGLKISADAEQYLATTARSLVENQSRLAFSEFMKNPEKYKDDFLKGKLPEEFGKACYTNITKQLREEVTSDKFTKKTKEILDQNLDALIEKTVTESKKDNAKKIKNILLDQVPIAVDAALLYYDKNKITNEEKKKIVVKAIWALKKSFDTEYILMPTDDATTHIEAELKRKLDS